MRRYIRLLAMVIMLFCVGFMAIGCGTGGGDDNTPPAPNPAEGSDWDSMVWDQGKWG